MTIHSTEEHRLQSFHDTVLDDQLLRGRNYDSSLFVSYAVHSVMGIVFIVLDPVLCHLDCLIFPPNILLELSCFSCVPKHIVDGCPSDSQAFCYLVNVIY